MKRNRIVLPVFVALFLVVLASCKNEYSCEGCNVANKPPVSVAGQDQVIIFPADSALLDGSSSYDPDGRITEWHWTKVSGPSSLHMLNADSAKTEVSSLDLGTYAFELNVRDDRGAIAKDTMELIVTDQSIGRIRIDSLTPNYETCTITIPNLDSLIPPGVQFEVYLRYYWGSGDFAYTGPFGKLDTIPDAQVLYQPPTAYWFWYEYSNGVITIHYPSDVLCEWGLVYHDVIIKW